MEAHELREQIDLYVAGMLDETGRRALEKHLDDDPRAAAWLAESRRAWEACNAYRIEAAPGRIVTAAKGRIQTRPASGRSLPTWRRWAVPAAAAVLLLSVTTAYWSHRRSAPPASLNPMDEEVVRNLDLLEHLDMLEQMDLVRHADFINDMQDSGLEAFLEALAS